jgi:drug/metabolite transporter (DMT)-like permease
MSWIVIAAIAYFLISLEVILDKFMLSSERVSHPAIYAFYTGILSLGSFLLIPFGVRWVSLPLAVTYIFFGIIFLYGILFLFFAFKKSEASRVTPVVGAVIPIVTYFLAHRFSIEKLSLFQLAGMVLLVLGGLFISFEWPLRINKKKFFSGFYHTIAAGILLAIAFTAFKGFYTKHGGFTTVFVWTRVGLTIGALSLLLYPAWRKIILHSGKKFKNPGQDNVKTGGLFVFNKILGGTGSILTNFAISLGSVTIVNAMVSLEYVFIFLLGLMFSVRLPQIFQEKTDAFNIFQKSAAIIIITAGVVLISIKF